MNAPTLKRLMAALALGASAVVCALIWARADRHWPISPVWPYEDGAHYHWFYRALAALSANDTRMAIWGWAAHAWVYSGTIPATRESSTEFAWRDWGREGYYRKRFMASLNDTPPEYFMVAVGPSHFMFQDRGTHGTQSLPGLDAFLLSRYERALDDGDTGLWIRRDVYDQCCRPDTLTAQPLPGHGASSSEWIRTQPGLSEVSWIFTSHSPAKAIVIPFRTGGSPERDSVTLGLLSSDGHLTGCADVLSAAPHGAIAMCVLDRPRGSTWKVVGRSADTSGGTWLAIGRPLVIFETKSGS